MSKTDTSSNPKDRFLKLKAASIVMNSGILAWTGKLCLGKGYLIRNLLNCLICLLQKLRTWNRGRNCSMSKG